ncbi:MAG: pyridoxamine 5'-phosphate oxidase family protein [Ignavibacteria bacterium]|nr:pyridoxamine 5'-phosphate oxidase family protein [Ignavibacteria bacterium]
MDKNSISNILIRNYTARLGCSDGNEVYVVPITYVYDGENILSHSNEGKKINIMRKNPEVCIEIDEVDDIFNWRSVIATGIFEELSGDESVKAFSKIYEKLSGIMKKSATEDTHPHIDKPTLHKRDISLNSTIVYRIKLIKITGRFERN